MLLSAGQRQHFEDFGYVVLPGLLNADLPWIEAEFEAVFADHGIEHDGVQRSCIVPFIDQRERLCALLDHSALHGVVSSLLGEDFNYVSSDGNYYAGDTGWHSDGAHVVGRFVKLAFYLDPVDGDTGCLRVIPGSHRVEAFDWPARQAGHSAELWDIAQDRVPHVALASTPGDVVVFNHNLMHASFGGGSRRRMFTMNVAAAARTAEEERELEDYIGLHSRFFLDRMHSDLMRETAGPGRQRHLSQVIAHEGHLAALSEAERAVRTEPSRG
jgi:hypothetical protein